MSDGIIRTALNERGSNKREKGAYFDMSDDKIVSDFNFQRGTSQKTIEKQLGHAPTDEEIGKAKDVPYSVDNIFCSDCENIFTSIETSFTNEILNKEFHLPKKKDNKEVENKAIEEYTEIELEKNDIKIVRLFFLMQVWRLSICDELFNISDDYKEKLRVLILKNFDSDINELKQFSLAVAYLNTLGGHHEYTRNIVGFKNDLDPKVIFMNDFIIQFSEENSEDVSYFYLYGLNDEDDFDEYLNQNEDDFLIQVFTNKERIKFLKTYLKEEKIPQVMSDTRANFITGWKKFAGYIPSKKMQDEYLGQLYSQKRSAEEIVKFTVQFYLKKGIVSVKK